MRGRSGIGARTGRRLWTPRDLGRGLKLWFRSDTGLTSSGGLVTAWADLSGAGSAHNYTASSAARPTFNATDSNFSGRSSMTFNGTSNFLSTSGTTTFSAAMTLAVVYKPFSNSSAYELFSDLGDVSGLSLLRQTATPGFQILDEVPNNYSINGALTANPHVLLFAAAAGSPGTQTVYVDGITTAYGSNSGAWGTFTISQVGTRGGASWFKGEIAEIIAVNRVLSTPERSRLMRSLGSRYGIAVAA